MKLMITKLKKLVARHGAAQVAVWLRYRDTRSILGWIESERIPECRITLVKEMLKERA